MTIAPIPPALGAMAAMRPEAASVLPNAPVAGTSTSGSAQSSAAQLAPLTETVPPTGEAPVSAALDALALKAAQATVAEGGLALLMADLTQALQIPGMPVAVQTAMDQILALRAPLNTAPTSADIKAALTQSNPPPASSLASLFSSDTTPAATSSWSPSGALRNALSGLQQSLETWLADAPPPQATALTPASSPDAALSPTNAVPPLAAELAQALRSATLPLPLQSALLQSLGSLPSSAPQTQPGAGLAPNAPVPLNPAAIQPVPAAGATPSELATDLKSFVPALGDALQGLLDGPAPAEAASPGAGAQVAPAAPDLESAFVLPTATPKSSSPGFSLGATAVVPSASAPAEPETPVPGNVAAAASAVAQNLIAALPPNIDPKDVMLAFQQIFKSWFDSASPSSLVAPTTALPEAATNALRPSTPPNAANAPPPPYRGGPTTAQPAVPSTLPAHADAVSVGARLLRETNAALAHQELLQLASLPSMPQGSAPSDRHNPQWMFEIPFATPQGSAVAQFKISRDGGGGNKGEKAPVWRAQFSLDVEPMGPIHAQVVLSGDRTWVSLWAEREESVARLRKNEGLLSTALKNSNFVAEVAFHAGAPRQPVATAGHFLDHAS